jgi:hypothetical protein
MVAPAALKMTSRQLAPGWGASTRKVENIMAVRKHRKSDYLDPRFARIQNTIADAIATVSERETPDTCLHFGIAWRSLVPSKTDGRLHGVCPECQSKITRSAFVN